ncbi:MAG: hypothetical protein R6U55_14630, partial [Desulfovermiculus sp.]
AVYVTAIRMCFNRRSEGDDPMVRSKFCMATGGNVGMLFALSLPLVFAFVGAAVDGAYMLMSGKTQHMTANY